MDEIIESLQKSVSSIENQLVELKNTLSKLKGYTPTDEFAELQKLLQSDEWSIALDPELICQNDFDKQERAEGIVDLTVENKIKGTKFLDFGCGEGFITKYVATQDAFALGYDINPVWKNHENCTFTCDWEEVKKNGPYDTIFVYDVIDHMEGDVVETISKLKEVMKSNSLVYVRCHPFTSKHASHLYYQLNKAYLHLVFTEEELGKLGLKPLYVQKIIHPLMTYKNFFANAGFQIHQKDQVYKESFDPFFQENKLVAKRIMNNWKDSHDAHLRNGTHFPSLLLEQQMVSYILR